MAYEFLKYFIKEPIYLIDESEDPSPKDLNKEETPKSSGESQVLESEPETITHVEKPALKEIITGGSSGEITSDKGSRILVVVRYPYVKTLPENEKELLERILRSVDVSINEITIINIEFGNIPEKDDLESYTHILIFDNDPSLMVNLNLTRELYNQQQIGKLSCIIADPLESIHEDTGKKSKLWKALKTVFDLRD